MFIILKTPHEDIHEPLTNEEVDSAVRHLLQGIIDVKEEEYLALKYNLQHDTK